MENVLKYKDVRFISTGSQHERYTSKPQFKRFNIINDELVCVELTRTLATLNKPIYAGSTELILLHFFFFINFLINTFTVLHV